MVVQNSTIGKFKFCGEEFTRQRINGRLCKPAHRTAYHHLKNRITTAMQTALDATYLISKLNEKHPHLQVHAEYALERIHEYADWRCEALRR
jgi:hypothetical protein